MLSWPFGCFTCCSRFWFNDIGNSLSKGVPADAVKDTLIANYNDIESVKGNYRKYGKGNRCNFIEPVAGNMGVVVPEQAFMTQLRAITKEHGILLVIDEVMTGFRSKFGGAQDYFGIEADITCMGKVIGGGMPVGAYGARAEIMDLVSPLGGVYRWNFIGKSNCDGLWSSYFKRAAKARLRACRLIGKEIKNLP